MGGFKIRPVEKSDRHYVLDNLLCWYRKHLVTEEWLKQTHCVSYFTKIHFGCFIIWPVHKVDTMCYLRYCVDLVCIHSLNSYLSRHTTLDVSLRLILFSSMIWPVKKSRHYVLATLLCWFVVHLVVEKWFKQTQCFSYFTNIYLVCFTIIPVNKADNLC